MRSLKKMVFTQQAKFSKTRTPNKNKNKNARQQKLCLKDISSVPNDQPELSLIRRAHPVLKL